MLFFKVRTPGRAARVLFSCAVCSVIVLAIAVVAQQPAPPAGKSPGGGRNMANPVPPLEESGFQPIFDSKSLRDWDGDPAVWRVEDGALVGETTAEKQPRQNTFLIWRGGTPANFELKLEYRLTGGNSGIQYRSIELPDIKWAMKGYQADIDAAQRFTGQIYEERGRGFLALRGQFSYIGQGQRPAAAGSVGDNAELKARIKDADWNAFHLIARGNTLIQMLNGQVMSMLMDDDTANRKMDGLIGVQVHVGPPMKIEVRNVRIKNL